jgi:hypothetical protein
VAVSLAPTPSLPESDANNQFLDTVVRQLAGKHDVVILDAEVPAGCADLSRVRALETPRRGDIGEQTRVVARARTLVGGFGDATALAAFCGTPAVAYHSEKLPTDFAERLQHAAAHHGWAPVDVQRVGRFKGVRLPREMSA